MEMQAESHPAAMKSASKDGTSVVFLLNLACKIEKGMSTLELIPGSFGSVAIDNQIICSKKIGRFLARPFNLPRVALDEHH